MRALSRPSTQQRGDGFVQLPDRSRAAGGHRGAPARAPRAAVSTDGDALDVPAPGARGRRFLSACGERLGGQPRRRGPLAPERAHRWLLPRPQQAAAFDAASAEQRERTTAQRTGFQRLALARSTRQASRWDRRVDAGHAEQPGGLPATGLPSRRRGFPAGASVHRALSGQRCGARGRQRPLSRGRAQRAGSLAHAAWRAPCRGRAARRCTVRQLLVRRRPAGRRCRAGAAPAAARGTPISGAASDWLIAIISCAGKSPRMCPRG